MTYSSGLFGSENISLAKSQVKNTTLLRAVLMPIVIRICWKSDVDGVASPSMLSSRAAAKSVV